MRSAKRRIDFPAVGDWVAVKVRPAEKKATLQAILPRKSKLSRKASGHNDEEQLIAANLDTVFVVTSLNKDFNARRLERYLVMVSDSGAQAVVLLSKADLESSAEVTLKDVELAAAGVPIHKVSAIRGDGLDALAPYIQRGKTVALIGSSGVGKSTLINKLLGSERQAVQEVRAADDRGRHTTTSRRMIPLPQGGLLIDTPGMRELQLWDSQGMIDAFADVVALISACRFRDCKHRTDAGCAVQGRVIKEGRLSHRNATPTIFSSEKNPMNLANRREDRSRHQSQRKNSKNQGRVQTRAPSIKKFIALTLICKLSEY